MKIHESGEMYLENILVLKKEKKNIRSIDIVNYTGYSKPSISRAVNLLKSDGMITIDKDGFIELTEMGEARAKKIYERHLILSRFFLSLGVSNDTASQDACKIEHIISEESFEKIKLYLSSASVDTSDPKGILSE